MISTRTCHSLVTHLSVGERLGCFHVSAALDERSIPVSTWTCVFISSGHVTRSAIASSYSNCVLSHLRSNKAQIVIFISEPF